MRDDTAVPSITRVTTPRTARVATLGAAPRTAARCWVALHGYGQLGANFAAEFAGIADDTRAIVAPEALQRFYDDRGGVGHRDAAIGASWMTREAREDDVADNLAYLRRVDAEVLAPRETRRLTVLGFSQGVATAVRWVATGEPAPWRLVLWAGSIHQDIDLTTPAFQQVHVVAVSGARDKIVTESAVARDAERLAAAGVQVDLLQFDGGHRLDRDLLRVLAAAD